MKLILKVELCGVDYVACLIVYSPGCVMQYTMVVDTKKMWLKEAKKRKRFEYKNNMSIRQRFTKSTRHHGNTFVLDDGEDSIQEAMKLSRDIYSRVFANLEQVRQLTLDWEVDFGSLFLATSHFIVPYCRELLQRHRALVTADIHAGFDSSVNDISRASIEVVTTTKR
jgi:hypothetical protein